jgi:hypothetical protein
MHTQVLVEGPITGDTTFVIRWLLSALEADHLLQREFGENPEFKSSIRSLEAWAHVEFRPAAAMAFLGMWFEDLTSFSLNLNGSEQWEWADIFVIMSAAGFFELTGNRYQMVIPRRVELIRIKRVMEQLVATEDEDCIRHPWRLLCTMAESELILFRRKLSGIGWRQRATDRDTLLKHLE